MTLPFPYHVGAVGLTPAGKAGPDILWRLNGLHHFPTGCVPCPFPGKSAAMTQGPRKGSQYLLRSVWSIRQPQARIHEPTPQDGGTHSAGAPPTD